MKGNITLLRLVVTPLVAFAVCDLKLETCVTRHAYLDDGMVEHFLPVAVELPLVLLADEALLGERHSLLRCCVEF